MPLEELRVHRCAAPPPDDLDAFWSRALAVAREHATEPVFTPYGDGLYGDLRVEDVTFSGGDGHPVRAWFMAPGVVGQEKLPCRVVFIGYGGGRGLPADHTLYPAAGYATFVMDSRSQGGSWGLGHTPDPGAGASGPEHPGVMTRGITDPETYYYRRLYADAVRAVETAAAHPLVDPERIGVQGFSQGGALSLATSALLPDRIRLCQAHMPYLCDIERAMTLALEDPYTELVAFLAQHHDLTEVVHHTLRYIDCALLAPRIRARAIVSVGLMDGICPPSSVFAAYNAIESEKELYLYPYNGHEAPSQHVERELEAFAREMA
jgi:cephalosporin-C deacetylase